MHEMTLMTHWKHRTCIALSLLWLGLSGCQTSPSQVPPLPCSELEAELYTYTQKYLDALEDIGNLRQQLKAANEQ